MITWTTRNNTGYEVSSIGDKRFSALYALMPDGRTIEMWYQCDVKGYEPGGRNWKLGKGKPPVNGISQNALWEMYLSLWRFWAIIHMDEMVALYYAASDAGGILKDSFAKTDINQARALATILNEWGAR